MKLSMTKENCTFDLQKVLDTPCAEAGTLYYKRKLSVYNLTVFDLATAECTAYIWDETQGKQGANDIATCLLKHLQSLPSTIHTVTTYSDTCSGQNKNIYLTAVLHNYLQSDTAITKISQKYLEPGHTQMEVDSVHSVIEHAKKGTEVFVPRDWINIIFLARENNSVHSRNH
jgi:hypothetical protein